MAAIQREKHFRTEKKNRFQDGIHHPRVKVTNQGRKEENLQQELQKKFKLQEEALRRREKRIHSLKKKLFALRKDHLQMMAGVKPGGI